MKKFTEAIGLLKTEKDNPTRYFYVVADYKELLKKEIDDSILPVYLGGTLKDPDERCSTQVSQLNLELKKKYNPLVT